MKKSSAAILLFIVVFQLHAQKQQMDSFVGKLMKKMTLEEKIWQLNQVAIPNSFVTCATVSTDIEAKIIAGNVGGILNSLNPEVTRKAQEMAVTKSPSKIPVIFGMDVIHGFRTIFPIPLALSCTWDMQLVKQSARISAAEASSWHGGTQTGNAVADVLFGDVNPAGKLTATFPRSVGQIPIYYNHKNTGRPENPNDKFSSKYIDSPNEPLYPFGYGLSYTTFEYGDISLSKSDLKDEEALKVTVSVKNTGKYKGEEVVQMYISDPVASVSRAVIELKGFQKIMLAPGESKDVKFTVTPEQLKFYNSNLEYNWEPGQFEVQIGGNSRDVKTAKFNWVK